MNALFATLLCSLAVFCLFRRRTSVCAVLMRNPVSSIGANYFIKLCKVIRVRFKGYYYYIINIL